MYQQLPGPMIRTEIVAIIQFDGNGFSLVSDRQISWVRDVLVTFRYHHRQKVFMDGDKFYDQKIFMECTAKAIAKARAKCKKLLIDDQSTLSLDLEATVRIVPVLYAVEPGQYAKVEKHCMVRATPDGPLEELVPRIEATTTIWSSKHHPSVNSLIMFHFQERWATTSDE
jgi:hypothetical protein